MHDQIWLFWILFLTPFGAAVIQFLSFRSSVAILKPFAILMSLIPLFVLLYGHADWTDSSINTIWLPALSIHFHLEIDTISLLFLYLTAVIIPITLCAVRINSFAHPHVFLGLVFILQGLLILFFTARDLALFTIFWEAMLLPLYFIINLWGGPARQAASLKFLIYMFAGSTLMVAAVLTLFSSVGTFNLDALSGHSSSIPHAALLCGIFLLAFAVKTPLFPFHAWLPDAYFQAPVAGTILLSALLSKAGVYGILRIGMGLFPEILKEWSPLLLGLAITGVLYGALAAWRQNDFKRLVAYSSFSHINFVLAGLFIWNETAQAGAILQAINHSITITALFLAAGWLEERIGSTVIGQASGLAQYLPKLCWLTLFFVLSSVALPGLNNFIGELMILFGLFSENGWLAALLGLSVILSVVYMLRWMQKMYFETPLPSQKSWIDIRGKEMTVAFPLVLLILWLGMYPGPVLRPLEPAAKKLITFAQEPR